MTVATAKAKPGCAATHGSTRITKLLQAKSLRVSVAKLKAANPEQVEAIERILWERESQFRKWGKQNHDMMTWLAILHEETGEMAEACLHEKFGGPEQNNVFNEAVQTAAVACQIVEYLLLKRDASMQASNEKLTQDAPPQ